MRSVEKTGQRSWMDHCWRRPDSLGSLAVVRSVKFCVIVIEFLNGFKLNYFCSCSCPSISGPGMRALTKRAHPQDLHDDVQQNCKTIKRAMVYDGSFFIMLGVEKTGQRSWVDHPWRRPDSLGSLAVVRSVKFRVIVIEFLNGFKLMYFFLFMSKHLRPWQEGFDQEGPS